MFGLELLLPVRFNLNSDIMFASEKCLNSDLSFFISVLPPPLSGSLIVPSFPAQVVSFLTQKKTKVCLLSQLAITHGTEVTNAGQ